MQLLLLILISSFMGSISPQISSECFTYFKLDHITFNMRKLSEIKASSLKTTIIIDGIFTDGSIHFDFCRSLILPEICQTSFRNSHAFFITDDNKVCVNLYSSHSSQNKYEFLKSDSLKSKVGGFQIVKKKPDFFFTFICDPNIEGHVITTKDNSFKVETRHACGKVNERARILEHHRLVISIFMFLFGFIVVLFGYFKKFILQKLIMVSITFYVFYYTTCALISDPLEGFFSFLVILVSLLISSVFMFFKLKSDAFVNSVTGFSVGTMLTQQALILFEFKSEIVT